MGKHTDKRADKKTDRQTDKELSRRENTQTSGPTRRLTDIQGAGIKQLFFTRVVE